MVSSLSAHGQLAPLVAVEKSGVLEVLDGFKRLDAAKRMGWQELAVSTAQMDEAVQWATMLALNRGPQSMSELDEALILRELVQAGLTQTQIAELVQRHKTWVSRRIGLVERLHPELVDQMKLGLLAPGWRGVCWRCPGATRCKSPPRRRRRAWGLETPSSW